MASNNNDIEQQNSDNSAFPADHMDVFGSNRKSSPSDEIEMVKKVAARHDGQVAPLDQSLGTADPTSRKQEHAQGASQTTRALNFHPVEAQAVSKNLQQRHDEIASQQFEGGDKDKIEAISNKTGVENMTEIEEAELKLSEPNCLTKLFVNRPCTVLLVGFALMFVITGVVAYAGWLELNDPLDREYMVWEDKYVNDFDKSILAKRELLVSGDDVAPLQSEIQIDWTVMLVYSPPDESSTASMWNKDVLISIREFENDIRLDDDYQQICLASAALSTETKVVCDEVGGFNSPLDLIEDPKNLENMTQEELDQVLYTFVNTEILWKSYRGLFDNKLTAENLKVTYLRSLMNSAGPIQDGDIRYNNAKDRKNDQYDVARDFSRKIRELTKSEDARFAAIERGAFGRLLYDIVFQEVLDGDVAYSAASGTFVFFFIWFHLESVFMTSLAMLMILLSFPVSYLIYSGILQIAMNTSLNQLTIFIVLGIAADDIFVFCDAWKQSGFIKSIKDDEHRRMAYSFKRSFRAIAVTSSTTAVAFLANATSAIRPIRAFGIYAAIIVPVNFLILILMMPAIQIQHDRWFKNKCGCYKTLCCKKAEEGQTDQPTPDRLTILFGGAFNRCVKKGKWVFVAGFLLLGIAATILASQIGPLTQQEDFLPDDFPMQVLQLKIENNFESTSSLKETVVVHLNWGIKDLIRDDVSAWDADDLGVLVWDDEFTVVPAANQQALLDLCADLQSDSNKLVKNKVVTCWIQDMDDYVRAASSNTVQLPISDEVLFAQYWSEFLLTEKGVDHLNRQNLGLDLKTGRLKYMRLSAQSFAIARDSYKQKLPERDGWDAYILDFSENKAPTGLKNCYQEADIFWAWMQSEQAFFDGAILGVIISGSLAFVIMLMATQNILLSLYSLVTVIMIVMCVIAVMVLAGWELGVSESIAMVIIIGFSVDYVVHLAAHYGHCQSYDRGSKSENSISAMGVSIFSGAVTTFGSGIFLFGGTIIFFQKFALIITMTVIFSVSYALVFYLAFLHSLGPQGKQGDLVEMWRNCTKSCSKKTD